MISFSTSLQLVSSKEQHAVMSTVNKDHFNYKYLNLKCNCSFTVWHENLT